MIRFKHKGNFKNMEKFLAHAGQASFMDVLDKYGQEGVAALAASTPTASGATAQAWSYEIVRTSGRTSIFWTNSHENDGVNIAVILQYGHGTGTGGYVEGIDYINPAVQPIFDQIAREAWKEVTTS